MSTLIKFDLKELRKLTNDKNSCVVEKKVTQNLALQPWCLGNLKESIKNLLDYKIGKFDKEFNGIVLSYKNLRVLQNIGAIRNDNADIHFQVQADYFIFKPYTGATLKGIVNKKSITHLGILVHRVFNVVIPRPTEEPGNKWIGTSVQEGQEVTFRIVVLDLFGALPYIRGELDESSLKLLQDGDVAELESKLIDPINVSYVNFDKTKPYVQRQSGDDVSSATVKNLQKSSRKPSNPGKLPKSDLFNLNMQETNGKSSMNKKQNNKSDMNVAEKGKIKRTSKVDPDVTETSTKQSKKHKRET